jgi:hypothetical protein
MWMSNAERSPPGTVTTRVAPGASHRAADRRKASGSSTCSSTSEQVACVAQPARPSPGSSSLSRSTCSKRPSGSLREAISTPLALSSMPATSTSGHRLDTSTARSPDPLPMSM